jgi:hypothetical protein
MPLLPKTQKPGREFSFHPSFFLKRYSFFVQTEECNFLLKMKKKKKDWEAKRKCQERVWMEIDKYCNVSILLHSHKGKFWLLLWFIYEMSLQAHVLRPWQTSGNIILWGTGNFKGVPGGSRSPGTGPGNCILTWPLPVCLSASPGHDVSCPFP